MKRILALFLVFILIFSITACGMNTSEKPYDGETMSGTEENSNVSTEEMLSDVPDTYDYALQVSINPEFILYLVGSEVVAYEALNEDAKKVDERAAIEDRGLHGALEDIVRFSYEEGFLKDGGDVTVTMVRAFGTEAVANELLKEAEDFILSTAEDCGISVNPVITIAENLNFSENTMQENIENPEGEKPENHNPATSTAEDFQTSEGEPDESREPQWIEVECSICYGSGESTCDGCGGSGKKNCDLCGGEGFTVCDQCGGTTLVPCTNCSSPGSGLCNGCNGTGVCKHCNGAGCGQCDYQSGVTCKGCAGSGICGHCRGTNFTATCNRCWGYNGHPPCNRCGGDGEEDCNGCGATGKVGCYRCGGSGKETEQVDVE